MIACEYLEKLRGGEDTPENIAKFDTLKDDLGYGLLLSYTPNVVDATKSTFKKQ